MQRKITLGIDLGTYNSAAVVLKADGKIEAISYSADRKIWKKTGESIKPFPSVVVYDRDGNVRAVGHEAKTLAEKEPDFAIWGVKRLLGKTYKEALEHGELDRMIISVEPDETNGRCMFIFEEKDVRPEDVCAELLRHIRHAAEQQIKTSLSDVVISVPAYFDAIAISATIDAAKRAGFARVDTIPEPVAAALAYEMHVTPRPLNFIVFDIGGGTLDVTAAEVWRSRPGPAGLSCNCKKNTGDTHLGGLDMDDRLVELLTNRMQLESIGSEDRLRLRRECETAKIQLSTQNETSIQIEIMGKKKSYSLTRFELEQALRSDPKDLITSCEEQIDLAVKEAGWRNEDVDHLLLVGGPAEMPCILQMLTDRFRRNPNLLQSIKNSGATGSKNEGVDRMMAVSIGAAKSKGVNLVKVNPYGYGFVNQRIEPIPGEPMYRVYREPFVLVKRDTVFPSDYVIVTPENPYYRRDKIYSVEIIQHVPDAEHNVPGLGKRQFRFLGEFQLAFRRLPYMMQVSMRINENGELETSIRNMLGSESVTYVGVGSLQRSPIDLPTSKLEAMSNYESGPKVSFQSSEADRVKQWGMGFIRFLIAKYNASPVKDRHMGETVDNFQLALSRWGDYPEESVNKVFSIGKSLLLRAQELKLIAEAERYRFEDELDAARAGCYKLKNAK